MKAIARFVTRGTNSGGPGFETREDSGATDLALMLFMKGHNNRLAPDRVYEIVDIMGELTIREVGKSRVNWFKSPEDILEHAGAHAVLSIDEYAKLK